MNTRILKNILENVVYVSMRPLIWVLSRWDRGTL